MKRTLLQRGAIIAACAAAFVLVSCGETEFDARTDTVYSLETPSVSAKAYPGVNVVSWKPVTGASSYKVTVYEEGAFKKNVTYKDENSFTDTELVNGKTYTYSVEAVSTTNPGTITAREVYATNSRGEASVRAIVPPAGTKSLELPAYENGYDGTNTKTVPESEKQWVINEENIKFNITDGKVYVTFPMKAYLKYEVLYYDNNLPHQTDQEIITLPTKTSTAATKVGDVNANNVYGHAYFPITGAGKYQLAVRATAYGNNYAVTDEIICKEPVTIEKLTLTDVDEEPKANYLSDGKTARISFTPAKKDGVYVQPTDYKVYRYAKGEGTTTEVSDIKENRSPTSEKTYYVDDKTLPNNKQVYKYIVVVTDGTKYGTAKTATLNIVTDLPLDSQTGTVIAEYLYSVNHFATGADNTVRISFSPAMKDGNPVPTDWYKVYRAESDNLAQTEVTSTTNKIMLDDADPNTYVIYDKSTDIDPAKGYVYTVVVENDGNFEAVKEALGKQTKGALKLSQPSGESISDWNDYKWTFSAYTSDNSKAISGIKEIKAYLLVTSTTQANPEANEVIANGTEISVARDTENASDTMYYYTFAKSALSTAAAKVSVVVTAKCDGYEDAISEVSTTDIEKRD